MTSNFSPDKFNRCLQLVNERIEEQSGAIMSGALRSMEDYRERIGIIRGLSAIKDIFETVRKEGETR